MVDGEMFAGSCLLTDASCQQVRVDKICVDGLSRTKDDIIIATVKDLFQAKDFQEVILRAHKVRGKLEGLGCFRNIGIFIDTSSGPGATPEGLEVFDFILFFIGQNFINNYCLTSHEGSCTI